ncbi:MAG: sel1 repeat family protein [Rhodospirillales bacterium]|nr:sel1 repeat family protein [Rhodospirillales bacterium]
MKKIIFFTIALTAALAVSPAYSENFDKGLKAFKQGNFEVAMVQWRPLAEKGDPAAQAELGHMYLSGTGVEKDYAEAIKWYRLASQQNYTPAYYYKGLLLLNGLGEKKDINEAILWLKKSAENENNDAPYILGRIYKRGNGVKFNRIKAYKWFSIGAKQGMRQAAINLKVIEGHMVPSTIRQAKSEVYDWMEKYRNE